MITGVIIIALCISTSTWSCHTIQIVRLPLRVLTYRTLSNCFSYNLPNISPPPKIVYRANNLLNTKQLTRTVLTRLLVNNVVNNRKPKKNDIQTTSTRYINSNAEHGNNQENQLNRSYNESVKVKLVEMGRVGSLTTSRTTITSTKTDQDHCSLQKFVNSLEQFERLFYVTTFDKLAAMNAVLRHDNGISFVQSALFLQLALIALSTEVDLETKRQIDQQLRFNATDVEKLDIINEIITSLPKSNQYTKFHWGNRLMLSSEKHVSEQFRIGAAQKLHLKIDTFNGTKTPNEMTEILNKLVETDSGGVLRNTFEEDDFSSNVEAVLVTTMYLRARWRSAPTLLNGTHPFHNSVNGTPQTVRMIRVNDIMKYATLTDWNAQAIEIYYFHPDLSLLILVPNGNSLKELAKEVSDTNVGRITEKMRPIRIAATLPLYTLRMTLLLPNKLRSMGMTRLVSNDNTTHSLRISHAVQRLMFWSEAGRYAFKDDGLEWDEQPEREILVDRPYIFYVRWKNITLMNGNFVL